MSLHLKRGKADIIIGGEVETGQGEGDKSFTHQPVYTLTGKYIWLSYMKHLKPNSRLILSMQMRVILPKAIILLYTPNVL